MPVAENEPVEPLRIVLLILVAAALLVWTGLRVSFLAHAERVEGKVVSVRAYDRPPSGRRTGEATRFEADVVFRAGGHTQTVSIPAGSSWLRHQPVTEADLQVGEAVPLVYDPAEPEQAERSSLWSLWQGPFWLLCILSAGLAAIYNRPWSPRYISATRYEEPPDPLVETSRRMSELLDELKTKVNQAR